MAESIHKVAAQHRRHGGLHDLDGLECRRHRGRQHGPAEVADHTTRQQAGAVELTVGPDRGHPRRAENATEGAEAEIVEEVTRDAEQVQRGGPQVHQPVHQEPVIQFTEGLDDLALRQQTRDQRQHRRADDLLTGLRIQDRPARGVERRATDHQRCQRIEGRAADVARALQDARAVLPGSCDGRADGATGVEHVADGIGQLGLDSRGAQGRTERGPLGVDIAAEGVQVATGGL